MSKRKLKWGETPWDTMSKEELLREVQRMFSALQSAESVLSLLKIQNEGSLFWAKQGSGGSALDHTLQVIVPVYKTYDEESMYRSFFRYATSLLFDVSNEQKWLICSACGGMWSGRDIANYIDTACSSYPIVVDKECRGVLRWLTWKDMQP